MDLCIFRCGQAGAGGGKGGEKEGREIYSCVHRGHFAIGGDGGNGRGVVHLEGGTGGVGTRSWKRVWLLGPERGVLMHQCELEGNRNTSSSSSSISSPIGGSDITV